MATFKLTHIGELDLDHLNEHYDGMVKLGGATIALDFNIEGTTLPLASAKAAETFVGSLAKYAAAAKTFIDNELGNKKDTTVKDFLAFHIEELPPKTLAKLLDKKSKLDDEHQLLGKLVLERVGLYPQTKGAGFAIFDFTFEGNHYVKGRRPITDQIIAVYLHAKGKVGHLSHES
jgi:hypothetical protein